MSRTVLRGLLTGIGLAASIQAAAADVRALVIGINDYAVHPKLVGAANDARAITTALRGQGVTDIVTLVDRAATREAFEKSWRDIVGRAVAGDVIFFSFAGHGIRSPEQGEPKRTPDGYDKGFALQPHDPRKRPDELLRDEQLYDLFNSAADRGLRIVFVADACHAGAGIRGTDFRNAGLPSRFVRYDLSDAPVAPPDPARVVTRPQIRALSVFSATEPQLTIKEVEVDGRPHGALSYAIAQGLAGRADERRQGYITIGDLARYVRPLVRVLAANDQSPIYVIPDENVKLLAMPIDTARTDFPALADVPLTILGGSNEPLKGAIIVDKANAQLIWDAKRRQLLNARGDVLSSDIDARRLQGAVDARRLLDVVRRLIETRGGLDTTLVALDGSLKRHSDQLYGAGTDVRVEIEDNEHRYATVFNLNADGTIHFMYPLSKRVDPRTKHDDPLVWMKRGFETPVTAPFGADFVVAIMSREPLEELHRVLHSLNGARAAVEAYAALQRALVGADYRIGIQAVYTCEKLGSKGTCENMVLSPLPQ